MTALIYGYWSGWSGWRGWNGGLAAMAVCRLTGQPP